MRRKRVAPNISQAKRLAKPYATKPLREDGHQEFVDFLNLWPVHTMSPEVEYEAMYFWVGDPWNKTTHRPVEGTFAEFLERRFPKKEFPALRRYLKRDGQQHGWFALDRNTPSANPLARLRWLVALNQQVRVWALQDEEQRKRGIVPSEMSPWARAAGWQHRERLCAICDRLFVMVRKDKSCCSDECANVHYQRMWRERNKETYNRARREKRKGAGR